VQQISTALTAEANAVPASVAIAPPAPADGSKEKP
jgi:hypothetical protein